MVKQKEYEMMHEQIETNTEAPSQLPLELSETQAREFLDAIEGERPSIRALAAKWGWHKSKVERLLKKLDGSAQHEKPNPIEFRRMLINAGEDFSRKFPSESAEETVDRMLADDKIDYNTAGRGGENQHQAGDDRELYYEIPHQAKIECRALADGGVEIWQEGQHGPDEASIIHVAGGNVVQLARLLLYAAGFQTIGIFTHEKGGCVDVEDGHLASNFYKRPGYGPVR